MPRSLRLLALSLVVVALLAPACNDGTSTPISLDNAWPNEDGLLWIYGAEVHEVLPPPAVLVGAQEDTLPPLPDWDTIDRWIADPPEMGPNERTTGTLTLTFAGTDTTDSGAEGQNLRVDTVIDGEIPAARLPRTFLASLSRARPDLRDRLQGVLAAADAQQGASLLEPILLHGGIFEKTEDHIGTLSDVDPALGWKYLEANVDVGHTFTFQLVPSLADDVYLHARMRRRVNFGTPQQGKTPALEVHYMVDYGPSEVATGGTPEFRTVRYILYGHVFFAPRIGPVASWERDLVDPAVENDPGLAERRLDLESRGPGN